MLSDMFNTKIHTLSLVFRRNFALILSFSKAMYSARRKLLFGLCVEYELTQHRFRLYPKKGQVELGHCRFVYDKLLEIAKKNYEAEGKK